MHLNSFVSESEVIPFFDSEEALSDEQKLFQRTTLTVQQLREEIARLKEQLNEARQTYLKTISPLLKENLDIRKEKVKTLDECWWNVKLSKKRKKVLSELISDECFELLNMERDQEIIALLEKHQQKKVDEIEEEQRKEEEEFKSFFNTIFEEEGSDHEVRKKKSKKELEKEKKEEAKAEAKKRSIKEIYFDLIKKFHPDKELDESKKAEKEESAKQITEAYKKSDLLSLLQFEIKLLNQNTSRVKELADEKLSIYNEVISEQKRALEFELQALKYDNEDIYKGMCTKKSNGKKFLSKISSSWKSETSVIKKQILNLKSDPKSVIYLIDQYEDDQVDFDFPFYFDE